jgi:hypothetical protein
MWRESAAFETRVAKDPITSRLLNRQTVGRTYCSYDVKVSSPAAPLSFSLSLSLSNEHTHTRSQSCICWFDTVPPSKMSV